MLEQAPTEAEAAMFGLTVEEATRVVFYWPDNARSIDLFSQMFTQWRMGNAGPIGLDYSAVVALMEINRIDPDERTLMMSDIRVMEDEALKIIRKRSKHG